MCGLWLGKLQICSSQPPLRKRIGYFSIRQLFLTPWQTTQDFRLTKPSWQAGSALSWGLPKWTSLLLRCDNLAPCLIRVWVVEAPWHQDTESCIVWSLFFRNSFLEFEIKVQDTHLEFLHSVTSESEKSCLPTFLAYITWKSGSLYNHWSRVRFINERHHCSQVI